MSLQIYSQLNTLTLELNSLLSELISSLDDEHELLVDQVAEQLLEPAQRKKQLSEQINTVEQKRVQLLQQAGWENNKQGHAALVQVAQNHIAHFADTWETTEELIRTCVDKNQLNGIIMENNRRNVETRLSILRGQPLSTDSYSSNGRKSPRPDSRSLAQV